MVQLKGFIAATAVTGAAAAMLVGGAATAAADGASAGGKTVPLTSFLRRCDWSQAQYVPSDTRGTAYVVIGRSGSTVTAEVHVTGFTADIWYGVRLVEMPRTGISCGAGDPGVGVGRVYTDGAGNGVSTVSAPLMQGATGAWVAVEGPLGTSPQLAGDFRSSDYVAPI